MPFFLTFFDIKQRYIYLSKKQSITKTKHQKNYTFPIDFKVLPQNKTTYSIFGQYIS